LAFPPGFASNGWFYVCYTSTGHVWTLSRLTQPRAVGISELLETKLLSIPQPGDEVVHFGGQIAFGPDGFLYASRGEGASRTNLAQALTNLWGKILRIDVESGQQPYGIPADNPFVNQPPFRPEIWAFGLRNPWRFSFDRVAGDLYIGDVGRLGWEEVDFQPALTPGGRNFGWPWREGAHEFDAPLSGYDINQLTEPVAEYHRCPINPAAVISGYLYRGPSSERLDGVYFYGDYFDGRVWGLKKDGSNFAHAELAYSGMNISSFGEDEAGHIYVAGLSSGKIYRLEDSGRTGRPYFGAPCSASQGQNVRVYATSPDSVIHYTADDRDPVETDPVVESGGNLTGTNGTVLKVRAYSANRPPSETRSIAITFEVLAIIDFELIDNGNALRLTWFGTIDANYEVQTSENLSNWTVTGPYQRGLNDTLSFIQPVNRSQANQRYCRVIRW